MFGLLLLLLFGAFWPASANQSNLPAIKADKIIFRPDLKDANSDVQNLVLHQGILVNNDAQDLRMMADDGKVLFLSAPATGMDYYPRNTSSPIVGGGACLRENFTMNRNAPLGKGSFGTVYAGHHKNSGKAMVIKEQIYEPAFAGNFAREERYQHELAKICPFIAPIHCASKEEGNVYFYMDLYRNGDLYKHSKEGRFKDPAEWARVAAQLLLALHVIHEQGIAHLDLKPQNIFLDEKQNALIADFGCAKADTTISQHGIVGSPAFMAVEIIKEFPYGRAADYYSFAATAYTMFHGEIPYPAKAGETMNGYFERIVKSNALPSVSDPQINEILQICGNHNPTQRWKDVFVDWNEFRKKPIWKGTVLDPAHPHPSFSISRRLAFKHKSYKAHKEKQKEQPTSEKDPKKSENELGGLQWYWWLVIAGGSVSAIGGMVFGIYMWRKRKDQELIDPEGIKRSPTTSASTTLVLSESDTNIARQRTEGASAPGSHP